VLVRRPPVASVPKEAINSASIRNACNSLRSSHMTVTRTSFLFPAALRLIDQIRPRAIMIEKILRDGNLRPTVKARPQWQIVWMLSAE
jgi:hypothetical protein